MQPQTYMFLSREFITHHSNGYVDIIEDPFYKLCLPTPLTPPHPKSIQIPLTLNHMINSELKLA